MTKRRRRVKTPTPEPELWERQPWETPSMWAAFATYLHMERPRSINGAYRLGQVKKGNQPAADANASGTWRAWSAGWLWDGSVPEGLPRPLDWRERADAYDHHQLQLLQERKAAARAAYEREILDQILGPGLDLIREALEWPRQRTRIVQETEGGDPVVIVVEPVNWTPSDIARLLSAMDRVVRLTVGEPTERTDVAVAAADRVRDLPEEVLHDRITQLLRDRGLDRALPAGSGTALNPFDGARSPGENGRQGPDKRGSGGLNGSGRDPLRGGGGGVGRPPRSE